jgi:hypothetical protein
VVDVLLPSSGATPRFIRKLPVVDVLLQWSGELEGIRKSRVVLLTQWSEKLRTILMSPAFHERILLLQSNV